MDVEKFLVKAEQALRKRAVPQAMALYRQVLVASPDHGGARAGLIAACQRKVELKGGPGLLDRAASKTLRATALGARSAGQHGLVVKSCEAALERDPSDIAVLALLGDALGALGRSHEALACWQARLEQDPRDVEALRAAGRLHYELKQVSEAIGLLDRAHAVDPHDPQVEKLRKQLVAEGTLQRTKYETAASSRELAKGGGAAAHEAPARLHRSADELADERQRLAARVAAAPGDPEPRRQLVRAQLKAGDPAAALAEAEAGVAAHPEDDGLLDLRGEALLAQARAALAAADAAGDPAARERAQAELLAQEIAEAQRRLRRNPGDNATRLRLGQACQRAGRTDEAIEAYQAVAADPRCEVPALAGLGACFTRKGLLPLARRQFEAALAKVGGVAGDRGKDICYSLGLVCERLGQSQEALARFMEIYEVDIHFKDVAQKIEALQA